MSEATEDRRGRCYDLAALYVLDHGGDDSLRLCHGWPVLTAGEHEGQRYGHAWVERSQVHRLPMHLGGVVSTHPIEITDCWDTMSQEWCPQAIYYKCGQIESDRVIRYDFAELRGQLLEHEDYGPWHDSPYNNTAPFRGEE